MKRVRKFPQRVVRFLNALFRRTMEEEHGKGKVGRQAGGRDKETKRERDGRIAYQEESAEGPALSFLLSSHRFSRPRRPTAT